MKMTSRVVPILVAFSLFVRSALGQDSSVHKTIFPRGITVQYGLGNYSVRDEYISKEKYSGQLPHFEMNWSRYHRNYGYCLDFIYGSSSRLKNYNVSTNIYEFALHQGFLYPLPKMSLFKRGVYTFFGPSTELYFFYNNQNIAVSGFDYAQSFAALFSLGVQSEIIYPIWHGFQTEFSLRLNVLSLGFRMVDTEEKDVSLVKLLNAYSGAHASLRLGARYHLLGNLSIKIAYLLQVTRIRAWDPLVSASNQFVMGITYKL